MELNKSDIVALYKNIFTIALLKDINEVKDDIIEVKQEISTAKNLKQFDEVEKLKKELLCLQNELGELNAEMLQMNTTLEPLININ